MKRVLAGMKALIKVGYGCNENCTFCHTLDVRHLDGEAAEVHQKIDRAHALGHGMVVLSGGEPTMRPELVEWATHVARLGMDFGLVTNGLMLAYPALVEQLLALRLRYVYQSLHGGTARVHNLMVRADTWTAARAAVTNLAGRGLDYTINCVITRQNLEHLVPLVDELLAYPDLTLKFSMVQPKGGGAKAFESLTPRVSDVAARVVAAIAHGEAAVRQRGAAGPRFAHDGIPLCLLPGLEQQYDDLKTHRYATMVEIGEPDFFPVDDKAKVQPEEVCGACALRGPCPGLYAGYHDEFGHGELVARHGRPRSNSYNYVFEELVTTDAVEGVCPLRDGGLGVTPWDRGRSLFVRNGPRIARFATSTRDFADVEIDRVKHDTGQLYLDMSRKPAPDDFGRDLVQLRPSALCAPCPEQARCTGLFEPLLDEDVFGRDDARVRTLLAELAGDVLDVGCGEGPYADVLGPRATAGALRYVGLDPDAARIAALGARWPWATLRVGGAEELADVACFDHVLVLRSWNHLRDPDVALRALVGALRPGGTLTIVDNVAFGLARTRPQAARGERSTAAFEHYRNDGAAETAQRVGRLDLGLTLVERRDVTPATSNQWLLRYCRAGIARSSSVPCSSA